MRSIRLLWVVVTAMFFGALGLQAQASLAGTVLDQAGKAVPSATVAVKNDPPQILFSPKPAILILIDGKPQGTSPAKAIIPPGAHTYTIKCPSGEITKDFNIGAGKLAMN